MKTEVKSTCCYCGVGCGMLIETDDGTISEAVFVPKGQRCI